MNMSSHPGRLALRGNRVAILGLVIAIAFASIATGAPIPPGDDCMTPMVIDFTQGSFNDLGQTTCGRRNDYDSTCLGNYDGGEDLIYQLDVTSSGTYFIWLETASTWTGMTLDDACPPDANDCIATSTRSSGDHGFDGLALDSGTYYLMIDTWPSPDCIGLFNLYIDELSFDCSVDGDINGDGLGLSLADYIYLVVYVYGDGPAPDPVWRGDLNADCYVDQGDIELYECYFAYGLSCFDPWGGPVHLTCCLIDSTVGACCIGDSCFIWSESGCEQAGGIYQGDWTVCDETECAGCCVDRRDDINGDGSVNISDLVYFVAFLFEGGPPPPCIEEGDIDGSGVLDISDLVYFVDYLFGGGPPPAPC